MAEIKDKNTEVVAACGPGEMRVALVAAGRAVEFAVDRTVLPSIAGNIYAGRVAGVAPALDAVFVDWGGSTHGFLPFKGRRPSEGEAVIVQVTRDPLPGKGAALTRRIALPGAFLLYLPDGEGVTLSRRLDGERHGALRAAIAGEEGGWVIRASSGAADFGVVSAEARRLTGLWRALESKGHAARPPTLLHREKTGAIRFMRENPWVARVICDGHEEASAARTFAKEWLPHLAERVEHTRENAFELHDLEEQWAAALAARVSLEGGGELVIETTEAFVAVDVNAGARSGGRHKDTAHATNLAAAAEVARQVRLRGIGGRVVVDFIASPPRERAEVAAALHRALAGDPQDARITGETATGLVEITRDRRRASLAETVLEARVEGRASALTVALEALRLAARASPPPTRIAAAPDVAHCLGAEAAQARTELETRLGRGLTVEVRAELPPGGYELL